MYNKLSFHDEHTGQIIVPILRPSNSHSNRWYVVILKQVIQKIRYCCPATEITIRADSGFSRPAFYQLADRLSCHRYWANFLRLLISSLAYELFLLLKQVIQKTTSAQAHNWQIHTIRVRLLKVGATIKKTKRRIYYRLSEAFTYQDLLGQLIAQ
ncbi:MAG TPA: transposase [Fodinibius sp.]|nr:transposase [Fodinibius sp.]